MSFEGLVGNEDIKNSLIKSVSNKEIVNSYMFVGQEGIGKKRFAKEFSKMILCLEENKTSCGNCNSCIKFESDNHPDFWLIEPDGNSIKIAQMRKMQENIYQKPIISNRKVFIIDDADKMTEEAQNSLLKTLEEPPEYVTIILIVANENFMLNTIRSRCLKIYFKNIETSQMVSYISRNSMFDNVDENIIGMCNGSFAKLENIQQYLEQYVQVENVFNSILEKKETSIIKIFKNCEIIYKSKDNIQDILEYMLVIIYNKIKKQEGPYYKYFEISKIVENTRVKLNSNSNYDMCIDEMLLRIWEEMNEKHSGNKV